MGVEYFDLIQWFVLFFWCDAFVVIVLSDKPRLNQGRGLVDLKLVKTSSSFIAGCPKAALLFCSSVILDVARYYLWLFSL